METVEIVRGVVAETEPDVIIAVDALAARKPGRVCTTVQLSDTGIAPGSGVGNHRAALTKMCIRDSPDAGEAVLRYVTSVGGLIDLVSFLPTFLPVFFPSGMVAFRMFRVVRILSLIHI